jgi:hypothetical protein
MASTSTALAVPLENFTNRIELGLENLIGSLSELEHDDLLAVRLDSKTLTKFGWRLECAADAELVRRVDPTYIRGKFDVEGKRNAKAVRELCAETGESIKTIYRNAQIHKVFFSGVKTVNTYSNLEEKSFYVAALESKTPLKAIEYFAEQKAKQPNFSTFAALQHVRGKKPLELDADVPIFFTSNDQQQAFDEWVRQTTKLLALCPRWTWLKGWLEEAKYEATRPSDTWRARIVEKITAGFNTADLLAAELAVDRVRMNATLNRLCDDATIKATEPERLPGSRGPIKIVYVLNRV